ncbi:MAG: EAL domain-containing protein [Burkholderiaceae bacterium]
MKPDLADLLGRATRAGAWSIELPARETAWTGELFTLLEVPQGNPPAREGIPAFYVPESRDLMTAAHAQCASRGRPFDEEVQVITARGRRIWVRSQGEAVHDTEGRIVRVQGVLQDVGARRDIEQQLQSLTMRLSTTLASIAEAFATLDRNGRFTFVNSEGERLLGRTSEGLVGEEIWLALDARGKSRLRVEMARALRHCRHAEFEEFFPDLGKWIEMRAYPLEGGLAVYFRDITDGKAAKDLIEHLAFFDPLTQLPNRQLLMDRLQVALTGEGDALGFGALMFIDLDHFKGLNDTLGHSKGDLLLQQAAGRLAPCVRASDTVARLGGDEFVVMLQGLGPDPAGAASKAEAAAAKILAALGEPSDLAGYIHHGTCSIGITLFGANGHGLSEVLKQTDLAMYRAKAAGRNSMCFYDPEMQVTANAKAALTARLREALAKDEFLLHYQPQIGADGCMSGVEALLRWRKPGLALAMPGDFVSQAEESGLILPIGAWVLEAACAQLAVWAQNVSTRDLTIAVNVSARQFRHPEFVENVLDQMARARIGPGRLRLELTESLLATDIDVTIGKMGLLKGAGVGLSIDDFGMGYSGLSYLKYMPLDELKIDRSFVHGVLTDRSDAAIARTIIALAQSLDLSVVAEGVETEGQRDFLARHGCDCYQGFLYCEPLPIGALSAFIERRA